MPELVFADELAQYGPEPCAARVPSLAEGRAYCQRLALTHYENFHVASRLLPRDLRPHFYAVYAYCRWSDDLADEVHDAQRSLELMDWWEAELQACYAGEARHPVFVALRETIERFKIPIRPFSDLLIAFRRDQRVRRYETADDVLDYCRYSANPVGRLVLYLAEAHDEVRGSWSDSICTGLQLANFCQDVAGDWQRGRIYLPQETCRKFGYGDDDFGRQRYDDAFRKVMTVEVDRAERFLRAGLPLVDAMPRGLRGDVWLFAHGGLAILDRIRRKNYDVWRLRPTISRFDKIRLLCGALMRNAIAGRRQFPLPPGEGRGEGRDATPSTALQNPEPIALLPRPARDARAALEASYAECQSIARRTAKNFYYSFLLLPRDKRRAMCALYAFLRHTDDLSDSDQTVESRREALRAWREALDKTCAGNCSDPILQALSDTLRRYNIPPAYLHDTIDGVEMDLTERAYHTFSELEEYCYRVASAVGLCCLHIWGFSDPAALGPARRLGVAFQMTNILRDLREDAERGRVYLPSEDLARFGYSADELRRGVQNANFRALVEFEIARAESDYAQGASIEPMISRDSRAAFRALVGVYRELLAELKRRHGDILAERVRLSGWQKGAVIGRALLPGILRQRGADAE